MPVINTLELEGVSSKSWGDAARVALQEAAKTIRGINRLEVIGTGTTVRDGKIAEYWSVTDIARVLQQVGVLPGPPH